MPRQFSISLYHKGVNKWKRKVKPQKIQKSGQENVVSEIEEAAKELEEDETLEDLIEETLYYNSAMSEIIDRIAEEN